MKTLKSIFAVFIVLAGFVYAASAQSTLTSLEGSKVDIERQRGKVVILAVGASWLPLSGKQAEFTTALAKKYAGRNVIVYFVATDSALQKSKNFASNADIQKFATSSKLTVPVLRDSEGALTVKKYAIDQLPSFVILDKNGNQSGEVFGGIGPKSDITVRISEAVDRLL